MIQNNFLILLTLLFQLFFLFNSTEIRAENATETKKNILLIFPNLGAFESMSQSIKKGVYIYRKAHLKFDNKINFIEINTANDLKDIADVTLAAIKKYNPVAIIGGVSSTHAMAIADVAESNKVIYIAPYATSPIVTQNRQYAFTTCFNDNYQSKKMAEFIFKVKKQKRGFILYTQNDPYSKSINSTFSNEFKALGGTVSSIEHITGQNNINEKILSQISEFNPEFIIVVAYQTRAAGVIPILKSKLGTNVSYYGPDSWVGGPMFSALMPKGDESISAHYVDHWPRKKHNKESELYFSTIKNNLATLTTNPARYDNTGSALGYDSALILDSLLTKFNSNLAKNLTQLIVSGVTGPIHFLNSNTPTKKMYIYRINYNSDQMATQF